MQTNQRNALQYIKHVAAQTIYAEHVEEMTPASRWRDNPLISSNVNGMAGKNSEIASFVHVRMPPMLRRGSKTSFVC